MKLILIKSIKNMVNLIIFDDLVFSYRKNRKISEFYCRSRKLNSSCIFIGHRILKTLIEH